MSEPTQSVFWLGDDRASDASIAGMKASELSRRMKQGHRVPPGFVITTQAFTEGASGAVLRDEAQQEVRAALRTLDGKVAVRSSGVAEDLEGASFAGQYESFLNVDGEAAVFTAIDSCARSADSERVAAYRAHMRVRGAPIAVLVQRMVDARAAGVAFGAHPVTGERHVVVISAVRGLGEALVSGTTDAEEWEVKDEPIRRRGKDRILSEDDARAVAKLARDLSSEPIDLEWAFDDTQLHLLQVRPMTKLPDAISWDPGVAQGFIRNFRFGEWIGAPVTPLFESWILTDLENGLHGEWERLFSAPGPRPLHVVVNGWYFYGGLNYDLSPWQLVKALPSLVTGMWNAKTRAQFFAGTPLLAHLGFDAELERWRQEILPVLEDAVGHAKAHVDRAPISDLPAIVQRLIDATARQFTSVVGVAGYAAKAELALHVFFRKHLPRFDGTIFELVSGAETVPQEHDVEGLDPYFATLGERGPLPPAMSPAGRAKVLAVRDAAEERALAATPPGRRKQLRRLIAEARRAHAARCEQTSTITLGWPSLRKALLRIGGALVERRVILRDDEVFFLSKSELLSALDGASNPIPIHPRRVLWQHQRQLAPPLVIGQPKGLLKDVQKQMAELLHHEEHDAQDALVGMPGSPGRVTGIARVVRSADELTRLEPGEILVAPVTTPLWTIAFSRAAAIVTDTGSVASHASIVAREHGIPAVVGTGDATTRIIDGQSITVDGGRGVVRLSGVA